MIAANSILLRIPAWVKFFAALVIVLSVSFCPRVYAPWLAVPAVFLLTILFAGGLTLWPVVKRLLLLEFFVLGVALMAFFGPGTIEDRAWHFAFIVARSTISLLALILFAASTPFAEMLRLFQRLRVPQLLVTTLALMHGYLFVLAEESARMRRARRCRSFRSGGMSWRTLSTVVGQLFLRASERADRVYDAMCARGWRG